MHMYTCLFTCTHCPHIHLVYCTNPDRFPRRTFMHLFRNMFGNHFRSFPYNNKLNFPYEKGTKKSLCLLTNCAYIP